MLRRIIYGAVGLVVAIGGCFLMALGSSPTGVFTKITPADVFTNREFWAFLIVVGLFCLFSDVLYVFIKTRTLVQRVLYVVAGFAVAFGVCIFTVRSLLERGYPDIPFGMVLSSPLLWGFLSLMGWTGLFFAALLVVINKKTAIWRLIHVLAGVLLTFGVSYLVTRGIMNEFPLIITPGVIISGHLFWGLVATLGGLYFLLPNLSLSIKGENWGSVPLVLKKLFSAATWQRDYRYFSITLPGIMKKLWTIIGKSKVVWQRKIIRYPLVAAGILGIYVLGINGLLNYMPNNFAAFPYIEPPISGYYLASNCTDFYNYLNQGHYNDPKVNIDQEVIIKNVDLAAATSRTGTYIIANGIQFMAKYPRQLEYLKNDEVIDAIGLFGGYSKEFPQQLVFNNCVFAQAGLVALPVAGGPTLVAGY